MSASRNPDSVAVQGGEFHSRIAPAAPVTDKGHKPGVIASEKDKAPEFHAKPIPAGAAPSDSTFIPNTIPSNAPVADITDVDESKHRTAASDTLGPANSANLNKGHGRPIQGMTSHELHHDGKGHRVKEGNGLMGVGAKVGAKEEVVDPHYSKFADQRSLDDEEASSNAGTRGTKADSQAQDKPKVTADEYASELPTRVTARGHAVKG